MILLSSTMHTQSLCSVFAALRVTACLSVCRHVCLTCVFQTLCGCVCVQKSVCERESIFSGVIETGAGQVCLAAAE